MNKQLETIANLMKELKAKFSAPEPAKFETATLMDGTIIEWENDLMVGTAVFVVDGENKVPAPAGNHTLEDGRTISVDENGMITEIIEVVAPEEMSSDKVNEIINAKMSEVLDTFSKGFESITSAFEAMADEHKALKNDFEAFKKLPLNKDNETQKFNRLGEDSNLTAKQNMLLKKRK